jgi:undecaprenyl-diphosphatase
MDYINAIIFGVVQGLTEFLPISSSGHLIVLHKFIDLPINNEMVFDVTLHLATLAAVVYFFRADIFRLLAGWFAGFSGKVNYEGNLAWLIILATLPAAIIGAIFGDFIESAMRSDIVVALMLAGVGALFIIFEKISRQTGELESINWKKSFAVGLAQIFSFVPGVSRSGITIIAGLGAGLKREAAVRFSFLISIPIILAASIKEAPKIFEAGLAAREFIILLIAFLTALISGFLAIKYFLRFSKKIRLNVFAYYRFILAALIIISLFF